MSKPDKQVPEPDRVADKLRAASIKDDNKPDTVNVDFGSPITPLQTRPSGLTSAATTTTTSSCSSSSSGSVTGRPGHTPITKKPDSSRPNPSAAQSGSSNPSATQSSKSSSPSTAQSGSSNPSATQSSKSSSPSTAQSGSSNSATQSSKSSSPSAAAQTGSKNPAAAQSGSAATHSKSSASSAAQSSSAAAHSKSSASSAAPSGSAAAQSKSTTPSATQSKSGIPAAGDKSSKSTNPSATQSKSGIPPAGDKSSKSTTPSAAQPGSTTSSAAGSNSPAGAKTGQSSSKTATGNQSAGRGSATSDSASGTAKSSAKSTPAPQQPVKIVPAGNLFPSGNVQITGMTQGIPKSKVLGPGAPSYGYGSIMRGNNFFPKKATSSSSSPTFSIAISPDEKDAILKIGMNNSKPEEVNKFGNELFKISCFPEALKLYERAIELSPTTAKYHSNRAATLAALSLIGEAVIACEEAVKLDPKYVKGHHRLGGLLLRLGQVDNAGKYFYSVEEPSDPMVASTLQEVDKHLNKCADARKRGEWNIVLSEASKTMDYGADFSPQLALCKVEALLKLKRLDAAQAELESVPKVEPFPPSFAQTRFFDMLCEAYTSFVKSQINLTLGRFENAVTAAEKASEIDQQNSEIEAWYRHVSLIGKARDRGNDLYESERYTEATAAYGEGLKYDPSNATLYCHRADCFFKVGRWESSIEDCNHALKIQPSLLKPLQQRAASYGKLEKWAEAVSDYERLRKELPYDKDIAESLFYAQVALRKSRGEVVLNMEFGGEVEEIISFEEFKSALTRPGVTVAHFYRASDQQCKDMSTFMEALCICYPSLHFLKVEMGKCPAVGDSESVRVVPTFKIYKNGIRMKVIVCPSKEALETSVRFYGR